MTYDIRHISGTFTHVYLIYVIYECTCRAVLLLLLLYIHIWHIEVHISEIYDIYQVHISELNESCYTNINVLATPCSCCCWHTSRAHISEWSESRHTHVNVPAGPCCYLCWHTSHSHAHEWIERVLSHEREWVKSRTEGRGLVAADVYPAHASESCHTNMNVPAGPSRYCCWHISHSHARISLTHERVAGVTLHVWVAGVMSHEHEWVPLHKHEWACRAVSLLLMTFTTHTCVSRVSHVTHITHTWEWIQRFMSRALHTHVCVMRVTSRVSHTHESILWVT